MAVSKTVIAKRAFIARFFIVQYFDQQRITLEHRASQLLDSDKMQRTNTVLRDGVTVNVIATHGNGTLDVRAIAVPKEQPFAPVLPKTDTLPKSQCSHPRLRNVHQSQ
jgi:hypothetical protein